MPAERATGVLSMGDAVRLGLSGGVVTFVVTSLPYLYATLFPPADRVYLGLMIDVPDHAQYWSWVTAARHGLFIPNTMTPEPNGPSFINPMMWLLAQVQGVFGLSFPALFQWWRLAATLLFPLALAALVGQVAPSRRQAIASFWVALLGGGFGWALVGVKYAAGLAEAPFPEALYIIEPNSWYGLMAYPYLPLAQAFMLIALAGAFRVLTAPTAVAWIACAIGALGVALLHAYDLIVVYAVLGTVWIVELVRARAIPWRLSWAIVLVLACSAPLAAYYQYLTSVDPLWRTVLSQYVNAGVWTPRLPLLPVLMGAPLVLALLRLRSADTAHAGTRFIVCWAVIGGVIIYVPAVFQVKLLAAWQVPLAVLGVDAWFALVAPAVARWTRPRLGDRAAAWAAPVLLAALVLPTNVYLFAWRFAELGRADSAYYLTADELAALAALRSATTPDDVALAPESIGRWIPNYGETRAYLAHWAMTTRYFERRDTVQAFFGTAVDDAWRRRVLDADGVTYVLWTSRDPVGPRGVGTESPLFEPVFAAPTAGVLRVRAAAGAVSRR